MINSKLIRHLRPLSAEDLTEFGKYLSRNCAHQEDLLDAFNYIKTFRPDYSNEDMLKIDFAAPKIFDKPWSSGTQNHKVKLRNLLSDLFLQLKAFLIVRQAGSGSLEESLLWLDVLLQYEQYQDVARHLVHLQSGEVADLPSGDTSYFLHFALSYMSFYNIPYKDAYKRYADLLQCRAELDTFYLYVQLKLKCQLASRRKFIGPEKIATYAAMEMDIVPDIHLSADFLAKHPLIGAYHEIYLLIQTENNLHYDKAVDLLTRYGIDIERKELMMLITYLQNHAASQVLKGNTAYMKKTHELNLLGLKHKVFNVKGLLSDTQYFNIIAFACWNKKFTWVKKFIREYAPVLSSRTELNAKYLGLGIVAFRQKDFPAALDFLNKVNKPDIHYDFRCKPLILACSYELNQVEDHLISMSKALEKFLNREKNFRRETVMAMKSFIRIFRKLLRKKINKEALNQEIKTTQVFLADWLTEKIAAHPRIK